MSVVTPKEVLLETLDRIRDIPVLVVGDLVLDRYIWGTADRISPEAPVPVVRVRRTEDRLGCAGNVVRNLLNLGTRLNVCGFIGDDEDGRTILRLLEEKQVGKEGVIVDRSSPTIVKTRVIAQHQQIVRIDREENTARPPALLEGFAALVDAQIDSAKVVLLSDYGKGAITESLMKRLLDAEASGRIGKGVRPVVLDPHPSNYDIYSKMTVVKPNRKEAEIAAGVKIPDKEAACAAAPILLKRWNADMMLISLGEEGLIIARADGGRPILIDTVAQEVFDVSGAGDTVTAVFAAALGVGADPQVAGDLANIAAGLVVAEVGTVAINREKLVRAIQALPDREN